MNPALYWDHAATSWPKPPAVEQAMLYAVRTCGNPGRGGHALSSAGEELLWKARQTVADFFGWSDPARVVFTAGCTASLNAVIHGLPVGVAAVSDLEHNAVLRPLKAAGWRVIHVDTGATDEQAVENFEKACSKGVNLVVCTNASNVTGRVLPVKEIAHTARRWGAMFCLDAAQTAGALPVPTEDVDYICAPGHKGLWGPMGVGLLLVSERQVNLVIRKVRQRVLSLPLSLMMVGHLDVR